MLDALDALAEQRPAIVLVGAQAIYIHTGEAGIAVAPYTTDADLALNPDLLVDKPILPEAMTDAGFVKQDQPGIWRSPENISVDLLVPAAIDTGTGKRSAQLSPPHDESGVARKVRGLEAALIDKSPRIIEALGDPADFRRFEINVAGPAALLIAKLHKIFERWEDDSRRPGRPGRSSDKDALDVLRILRKIPSDQLGQSLTALKDDGIATGSVERSVLYLEQLFGNEQSAGTRMAVRATLGLENPDEIAASCVILADDLLREIAAGRQDSHSPRF